MMELKQVTLEQLQFGIMREFSDTAIRCAPDVVLRAETRSMVASLRARVLGEKLATVEVKWPADWWQALKERWFPAWALRRWPVTYRREKLEAVALYPKISLPEHGPVLQITKGYR